MKKTLNGIDFHTYIAYGANEVIKNRDELNRINVFPVADGDTGSNLAQTLQSMVEFSEVKESFHATAASVSEAGILGARGNSGVLFAQFISGFAHALKGKEGVDVKEFVMAAQESSIKLQHVLSNPVEGTIITVIRAWVESLVSQSNKVENFEDLLIASVPRAEEALLETTSQMELLRLNHVVDSGAKGFVIFLKGIASYIQGKAGALSISSLIGQNKSHISEVRRHSGPIVYRYCYECILRECMVTLEELKLALVDQGDSLIIAGDSDFKHIHIHTDSPADVTAILNRSGHVTRPKVEDMLMQSELIASHKEDRRIAIVTDSIADIPPEVRDLYGLHVIPLSIHVGEKQYFDRLTIDPVDFYDILDNTKVYPSSSLASEPLIKERLEWLLQYYDEVLVITVASALSGTYDAFRRQIASLEGAAGRIGLIDSRLNSGAQGLLVLKAARLVEKGLSMAAIMDVIEEDIDKSHIFVALRSFNHARKSGRIPKVVGDIGTFLNLKPIVSLDKNGKGTAFSVAFSQITLLEKIYKLVENAANEGIQGYAVVHGGDGILADKVAEHVQSMTGMKPEFVSEISSITALHAGPGAIAIAFMLR